MENREEKLDAFYNRYLKKKFPVIDKVKVKFEDFKDGTYYSEIAIIIPNYSDMVEYGDDIKKEINNTLTYMGIRFSRVYFANYADYGN